jgi:hypothetical protein
MPKKRAFKPKKTAKKPNIVNSAELQELLSRPALLKGENAKTYDDIQARLMECLAPRDFIEQMLIAEYMCWSWEARRYSRHKALAIEAAAHKIAQFQANRRLEQAKAEAARQIHRSDGVPDTELGRIDELEDKVRSTIPEIDEILLGSQAELIHAQALRSTIDNQLRLDRLLNDAVARQYQTLTQLEAYRRGLAKRTEKACGDVIDAEFNDATEETEGQLIPLVPSPERRR